MEQTKKKRKGLGCFGALLVFLLIVAAIIGAIVGVFAWLNAKEQEEIAKELQSQILTMDASAEIEAYLESLKEVPSDIEGMTQYEKYEMGLIPADGADSDGDGLTDQEELEQYKTDPLEASTSGDGIPDGMKLKAGLELTGVYGKNSAEYASFVKQVVPYDNVVLKDKATAKNALSHVREKERCAVSGAIAVKAYKVYSYTGTGEIDFSAFMEDGVEYAGFMVGDGIADEVKSLRIWNGKVTFKANGANCTVGIYAKPGTENTVPSLSQLQESGISSGNDAMIFMAPIVAVSGEPIPIVIWERNPLLAGAKYKIENSTLAEQLGLPGVSTTLEYIYLDSIRYDLYHGLLNKAFSFDWMQDYVNENGAELSDEEASVVKDILSYSVIFFNIDGGNWDEFNDYLDNKKNEFEDITDGEQPEGEHAEEEPVAAVRYVSSFQRGVDTFPFQNLCTYISQEGNCAGFAQIYAQLYNDSIYPVAKKQFMFDIRGLAFNNSLMGTYSYDLTEIEECKTLFDRYLNDYKSESYWKDTYGQDMWNLPREAFSEEDAAFLDFLGFKYVENNLSTDEKWHFGQKDLNKWSDFEKLIEFFENKDKVLTVTMIGSGKHALTAYGVEQDSMNPDVWYILVDDCNILANDTIYLTKLQKWFNADCRIKITKVINPIAGDFFEWEYFPLGHAYPSYHYGTQEFDENGVIQEYNLAYIYGMTITDEDYDVLLK